MATAAKLAQNEELDPQKRSSTSRHFEDELRQRIVGQNENEAVEALVDLYQVFCAGIHSAGRPGDKGLAFLRDTQQSPSLAEMLLAASSSSLVPYTEARF
jgi:hypothetical protein